MGGKETVDLNDVHPTQQMWVASRVWAAITRGADYSLVHTIDEINGTLCFICRTKRCGSQKVRSSLESAPRIVSVVGMLRDTCHRQWMQRLHQQCTQPTDEHRRVGMHPANRAIVGKPARCRRFHQLHHSCLTLGASDTIAQRLAE